jgi:hypothetical protein
MTDERKEEWRTVRRMARHPWKILGMNDRVWPTFLVMLGKVSSGLSAAQDPLHNIHIRITLLGPGLIIAD